MNKVIQNRNPRVSLTEKEIEYLMGLVDKELIKSQKFNRDEMMFKLTIFKKLETAK